MKLRKINDIHFVITDGNPTTNGDYAIHSITLNVSQHHSKDNNLSEGWEKIKFSTQPLEGVELLSLSEVKELIGVVDVGKKGWEYTFKKFGEVDDFYDTEQGFIDGYNQALEDNKEKKYTEEDISKALSQAFMASQEDYQITSDEIIQTLQPKTEWEVEFKNGKLRLA